MEYSPLESAELLHLTRTKNSDHGDFTTNIAMRLAKAARKAPRQIAEAIAEALGDVDGMVESIDIAGPGFINLKLDRRLWLRTIDEILTAGETFGRGEDNGTKVLVEYVSANPTGPIHVGHGRGAVTGHTLARIMDAAGYDVTTEYYVNDSGNQIRILALSLFMRVVELGGHDIEIPADGYPGDYIVDIARAFREEHGDRYDAFAERIDELTEMRDEAKKGHVRCFRNQPQELEKELVPVFGKYAVEANLVAIKRDLAEFGIEFDRWQYESTLLQDGSVDRAIQQLQDEGRLYDDEGKLWFRSEDLGDDKDRVVRRENGITTYFASDIAYHREKVERGFDQLINVWGADHHGYMARVKAALSGFGYDPDRLEIVFIQIARILRSGEPVRIGKRTGNAIWLRDVLSEAGVDATRFFFIMRRSDSQLDFDLDLARKRSMDNPVFYVQYGHARCQQILLRAKEAGHEPPTYSAEAVDALRLPEEIDILRKMSDYPAVLLGAAQAREPHRVVFYLEELIGEFHSYYTRYKGTEKIVSDDADKTRARLLMVLAMRQVLRNGMGVLGVSAPDYMEAVESTDGGDAT